jgi:TIR domain
MNDEQQPSVMTDPTHQRNSVFISYSRSDKKYLDELQTHLAYYERAGTITYWDDTKIRAGDRWRDVLDKALQSAKIAIFLVSADFFASDFIAKEEMPPLLAAAKRGELTVLSVILSACSFNDSDLSKFQATNLPSSPLNQMPRGKRAIVWHKVIKDIKDTLGH